MAKSLLVPVFLALLQNVMSQASGYTKSLLYTTGGTTYDLNALSAMNYRFNVSDRTKATTFYYFKFFSTYQHQE